MWFKLELATEDENPLSGADFFSVQGSDLATLARDLLMLQRPISSRKKLSFLVQKMKIEVRRDSIVPIDWTSREAQIFLHAVSAVNCENIEINNFMCFPLPLLQACIENNSGRNKFFKVHLDAVQETCDDNSSILSEKASLPYHCETTTKSSSNWKPYFMSLSIKAGFGVNWSALWSWLEKTFLSHPDTCFSELSLSIGGGSELRNLNKQHCSEFLGNLCSCPTESLIVRALALSSNLTLSFIRPQSTCNCHHGKKVVDVKFSNLNLHSSDKRLDICVKDYTDWVVLKDFLQTIIGSNGDYWFGRSCWREEVNLSLGRNFPCVRETTLIAFLQCLNTIASFKTLAFSMSAKFLWAPLVSYALRQTLHSNDHLVSLSIRTKDLKWIDHDFRKALKKHASRIERIDIQISEYHQGSMRELAKVRKYNCSISCSETPRIQMDLRGFNKIESKCTSGNTKEPQQII